MRSLRGAAGHWILDVADAEDLTALDAVTLPPTVEIDGRCIVRCMRATTDQPPET